MDSCFVLPGTRQHCVAKISNISARANTHKLLDDSFTFRNLCALALWLALHIFARVLMSPKKDETAIHYRDPALPILVMLVSRNVFHVVSALHCSLLFLFTYFFADQILLWQRSSYAVRSHNAAPCSFWFLASRMGRTQSRKREDRKERRRERK